MSSLIKTDVRYRKWITAVSKRFRQSQLKAAVKVNDEMLRFYWGLGRDISLLSKEADYGSNFYKTISGDLKDVFPDIKSFSPTNLKYMRYFYEMYPDIEIRQQTADALTIPEYRPQLVDGFDQTENRPQPVDDLKMIFYIPWGHNRMILDKCKGNPEKALFYVKKTLENNKLKMCSSGDWGCSPTSSFAAGRAIKKVRCAHGHPACEIAPGIYRCPACCFVI